MYVASSPRGYINAFEIDGSTGMLTPVPGSPFNIPVASDCRGNSAGPNDVIDNAGKYIYTADRFIDSISGFDIGSNGALTSIAGSPWSDEGGCDVPPSCDSCVSNPSSLAIDGTGKFLYGDNSDIEEIAIYSIGANGALSFVKTTGTSVGCVGPIRADATGKLPLHGVLRGECSERLSRPRRFLY